jgi:ERCC4-type nuclease
MTSPRFSPTIVIDSREQRPLSFAAEVAGSVRKALPAGDYSIEGHETVIAVERKTLEDYISSLVHARDRFIRELTKLSDYRFAWIVVEGSLDEVLHGRYASRVSPAALLGLTTWVMLEYRIPVLFAHDRPCARAFTEALLLGAAKRVALEKGRDT